jgi:hypothetical protein
MTAVGIEQEGWVDGVGVLTFGGSAGGGWFCNVSIPINGQFEIENADPPYASLGCLSVNTALQTISNESPAGCAINNGAGYPWDRWTAIGISYHSHQAYMFKNVYNGKCIAAITSGQSAYYTTCNTSDHYQWFEWPGSGL